MNLFTSIVVTLNAMANTFGTLLYPIGLVPAWLSTTLVGVLTGAATLVVFKYTSNQRGIKRVRQNIRANLLAVKLFKDDFRVGLKAQGRVLLSALRLLCFALAPAFVMTVPMILLLGQLGLWYQRAPLPVGEEAVVTVKLNGAPNAPQPTIELLPTDAAEDLSGPVWVASQREVCWNVRARQPGQHRLQFRMDVVIVEKEFAVGTGVMRVSTARPDRNWSESLLNPHEKPFDRDSIVKSIEIEFPTRSSWTGGTDNWVIFWFVISLVAGFCLRGVLKVNI